MADQSTAPVGYDDTPTLPGGSWRVHDARRPQPREVRPGASVANDAPSDATVLFDGVDLSQWAGRDGESRWTVQDGYVQVAPRTGDIETRSHFGDCQLHVEWAAPREVRGNSQGRGNSGVFLLSRYEIQVLDSYRNRTYADGSTAALYGQFPPLVNAAREPGAWQTYDVVFLAPCWEGPELISPAHMTVIHNGVVVHHHRALLGPTGHRVLASYDGTHPSTGPLKLQDHGDLVRYRNIWIRPLGAHDQS